MKRIIAFFMAWFLSFSITMTIQRTISNCDAEKTIKPPPIEAQATTALDEIVTGLCTFGDCPVATTEEVVKEFLTTAEQTSATTETVTDWDGYDEWLPETDYATYSADEFRQLGEAYWGGWRWTWYSEKGLPGTGLHIPGRHTEGCYVRDGDGYICLASDALDYGTVIATPFGSYGRVYDCGCDYDTIDVYVSW